MKPGSNGLANALKTKAKATRPRIFCVFAFFIFKNQGQKQGLARRASPQKKQTWKLKIL
jgi:hypothetical protein